MQYRISVKIEWQAKKTADRVGRRLRPATLARFQLQKLNPFPSHNLPHSDFRLHPLPVLQLKSEGPHMTKRISDKQSFGEVVAVLGR